MNNAQNTYARLLEISRKQEKNGNRYCLVPQSKFHGSIFHHYEAPNDIGDNQYKTYIKLLHVI
jgi:hypothetical protein